jgi:sialidase-1
MKKVIHTHVEGFSHSRLIRSLALIVLFLYPDLASSQDLNPVDIFVSGTEGVTEFRIPSMITTQSGKVLAVCDARVDKSGDVPNNVDQMIRRSSDNGKTWEDIRTIIDFPNMEGAADPQLMQDESTGRIFLFYCYSPGRNEIREGPNRYRRHLNLHYVYSDDDGTSWSLPIVVEHGIKKEGWHSLWPGPGRGTTLESGRLIVPVSVLDTAQMYSYYLYSDDHGQSWQLSSLVGTNINEPTMVELQNGSLLVNARNRTGHRALVTSNDAGISWSEPLYHEQLQEPSCQGSMINYVNEGKDILIFSNPDNPGKRRNMSVKVSHDNGNTWKVRKVIHEGPAAYSCLTILPNGNIGLLYENGEKSPYEKISFVELNASQLLSTN